MTAYQFVETSVGTFEATIAGTQVELRSGKGLHSHNILNGWEMFIAGNKVDYLFFTRIEAARAVEKLVEIWSKQAIN